MIFLAAFIGYSVGTAPVVGYHYGAQNHAEMKNLLKRSLVLISIFSVSMVILAQVLSAPLSVLFVGYDESLFALTKRAFLFYSFSFLFSGLAIYGSSFFTALGNGGVSALISFLRTLVFQIIAVLVLPLLWGIDGIWISVVVAEFMAALLTAVLMILKRTKYKY